ncbi:hypothetical protein RF11_15267 [Thelohanellus kitauei]|uniref:Uncharacterized protein n=1 Tax=Thelohanellus kitauei TaxID=669202 RepID=A0A0C2IMY4_THEKT|nr:hypothetical protein RF11_15267 [Thelohanellus kitauei]
MTRQIKSYGSTHYSKLNESDFEPRAFVGSVEYETGFIPHLREANNDFYINYFNINRQLLKFEQPSIIQNSIDDKLLVRPMLKIIESLDHHPTTNFRTQPIVAS